MNNVDSSRVREDLQEVFREVFGDDSLAMEDSMSAEDVPGWDSLAHIQLIIATEKQFGIKFATAEISELKGDDQNIGSFLRLIEHKLGAGK